MGFEIQGNDGNECVLACSDRFWHGAIDLTCILKPDSRGGGDTSVRREITRLCL